MRFCWGTRPIRAAIWVLAILGLVRLIGVPPAHAQDRHHVVSGDHAAPPYSFLDEEGRPRGFAIDVLDAVGHTMGLRFEYRLTSWNEAYKAAERREVDLVAGMIPLPERRETFAFSTPFVVFSYALFARTGTTWDFGDLVGRRVGVQQGDAAQDYLRSTWPTVDVVSFKDPENVLRALAEARVDAAVLPRVQGVLLARRHGISNVAALDFEVFVSTLTFAVAPDDPALLIKLNEGLAILKETGDYDTLYRRWFGVSSVESDGMAAKAWSIFAVLAAVLMLSFAWSWELKRQVRRKTAELAAAVERLQIVDDLISRSSVIAHVNRLTDGMPFQYVSKNVRLFDLDPQALVDGRVTSRDTIHPDDYPGLIATLSRHAEGGPDDFTASYRVVTPSGKAIPVENLLHIHRDGSGKALLVEGLVSDVTERRDAERALLESNERARASFHASPDGIAIVRARDSRIVDANPGFERLFGWSRAESIGRTMSELALWSDAHDWQNVEAYLARDGAVRNHEATFQVKTGPSRTGLVHAAVATIDNEFHYLVIVCDITELRHARDALRLAHADLEKRVAERTRELEHEIAERLHAENALQEANEHLEQRVRERTRELDAEVQERRRAEEEADRANRAKTEFLANVSHELRTPLNSIIGFSDILSAELFGSMGHEEYVEYARDINQAGKHLLGIINDILDVSRLEMGAVALDETRLDVRHVLRACRRLIETRAEARRITLSIEAEPDLPALRADERRIKQILINLLSNAVKFTAPGGRVDLAARVGDDGGFEFVVTDTGIGIAPEQLNAVMGAFHQADGSHNRRFEGVGIGLPLSARIAQAHGGTLILSSRVGFGTTVRVTFPPERTVRIAGIAEASA